MSRKTFTSLRETFSSIANRKSEAARARRKGTPEDVEHSSDVYADSCAEIAARFEAHGFRYAKSGPHFSRKRNGFTHKVSFQTSYHNIPGQHVSLSVAANVRANKLKKWRENQIHPRRNDDWVGGGLIHLLGTDLTYVTWELAHPEEREKTIADVVSFIEAIALPYFDSFDDPTSLIGRFEDRDFPAMDIGDMVEFTLCFGSRDSAQRIIDRFVQERTNLSGDIIKSQTEFEKIGFPSHHLTKYADLVAFLRLAFCLKKGAQPVAGINSVTSLRDSTP